MGLKPHPMVPLIDGTKVSEGPDGPSHCIIVELILREGPERALTYC